jgi:hypothetical protein
MQPVAATMDHGHVGSPAASTPGAASSTLSPAQSTGGGGTGQALTPSSREKASSLKVVAAGCRTHYCESSFLCALCASAAFVGWDCAWSQTSPTSCVQHLRAFLLTHTHARTHSRTYAHSSTKSNGGSTTRRKRTAKPRPWYLHPPAPLPFLHLFTEQQVLMPLITVNIVPLLSIYLCTFFSHRDNSHTSTLVPSSTHSAIDSSMPLASQRCKGGSRCDCTHMHPHPWLLVGMLLTRECQPNLLLCPLVSSCADGDVRPLPRPSRVRLHWSALQIRSRLKIWHKFWAVIYPGKLVLYEDENQTSWKGTLILSNMQARHLLTCPLSSTSAAFALHSSPLLHVSLTSLVVYQHSYHHPLPNRPSFAHCDACHHCAHLYVRRRRSTPVLRPTRQHGVRHATSPPTHVQVQERPTKKAGFSWKCTTEFGQDIFARKGVSAFHNHSCINEPPEFNNSNSRQNFAT